MLKARNQTFETSQLIKLLIQKQKYCCNYSPTCKKLMLSVFKMTNQQKKRIKTFKETSLLIAPLLTYLVKNNNLLSIIPTKKTRITNGILVPYQIRTKSKTRLSSNKSYDYCQEKKKIFLISNISYTKRKAIIPANVLGKKC